MLLFVFYVAVAVVGAIVLFSICRLVDHILVKREIEHKASIVVGYEIPEGGKQIQMMAEETIDHITARMLEQTKKMTEDWFNVGKTD